jgi:hypothetical protein
MVPLSQVFRGAQYIVVKVVIPALGRLRQEDLKLEASLDYIVRPCLRKKTTAGGITP